MARAMWRKALDPGGVEAYVRAHQNPWPSMVEHIRSSGMRNYSIFVDCVEAIGYFEHDDLQALDAFNAEDHPVAEAWRDLMRPLSADKVSFHMGLRPVRRQVFFFDGGGCAPNGGTAVLPSPDA